MPDRPRPGPVPGGLIGLAAGVLLAWLWTYADREVALAVTLVMAGLVAAIAAGAPEWRTFAIAMLTVAVLASVGLVWLVET